MNSPCRSVVRSLATWTEREGASDPVLQAHVDQCAECAARIARARALAQALRQLPRVVAPRSPSAAEVLRRAVPVAQQVALGEALARALPRLRLPEVPAAPPARETRHELGPAVESGPLASAVAPILRAGLRTPMRTPGWLWSRVRAELQSLRTQHEEVRSHERSARMERNLQRWFHAGLASAAALVLALWSSSTLQAKIAEDEDVIVIHHESVPLVLEQLPEAIHEAIVPERASRPVEPHSQPAPTSNEGGR